MEIVDDQDFANGEGPAPIVVVMDNGPCFRGVMFAEAFTDDDPPLRHVRTRVRSPQTNGVAERFFGTLPRRDQPRQRASDLERQRLRRMHRASLRTLLLQRRTCDKSPWVAADQHHQDVGVDSYVHGRGQADLRWSSSSRAAAATATGGMPAVNASNRSSYAST